MSALPVSSPQEVRATTSRRAPLPPPPPEAPRPSTRIIPRAARLRVSDPREHQRRQKTMWRTLHRLQSMDALRKMIVIDHKLQELTATVEKFANVIEHMYKNQSKMEHVELKPKQRSRTPRRKRRDSRSHSRPSPVKGPTQFEVEKEVVEEGPSEGCSATVPRASKCAFSPQCAIQTYRQGKSTHWCSSMARVLRFLWTST